MDTHPQRRISLLGATGSVGRTVRQVVAVFGAEVEPVPVGHRSMRDVHRQDGIAMAREGVRVMWRRLLILAALAALLMPGTGCMINQYSSDPLVRMEQMMIDSENLRQMHDEWRRFWMNDQPSHLTPYRIHGGIGPASSSI